MTHYGPLSFPPIELTCASLLNSSLTDGSLGWSHKEGATCNLLLFTKHPFWFATNWSKKLIWCWDLLFLFLSINLEARALSRVWIVIHFVFAKAVTHNVLPPSWERPRLLCSEKKPGMSLHLATQWHKGLLAPLMPLSSLTLQRHGTDSHHGLSTCTNKIYQCVYVGVCITQCNVSVWYTVLLGCVRCEECVMYGVVGVQWNKALCRGGCHNVKFGVYNMACLMYVILCGRMYVCWCIFVCLA